MYVNCVSFDITFTITSLLSSYPIAIDLLAKKLVDVKPLITHRFNFEEFQKAFDFFHTGQDGAVKCMISC